MKKQSIEDILPEGLVTLKQSAEILGISNRQMLRIWKANEKEWFWNTMRVGKVIVLSEDQVLKFKNESSWTKQHQSK